MPSDQTSGPVPPRLAAALAERYRVERELGAGGMATVYLAFDLKHDRKVALKVLKPELAAVLGAERFVVEIKTTAALQHPHILPLFDSGSADGFLYYVMPFIEGETLRAKLDRETQFGVDEAVRITTQVADALDYAHRHGVIHRDIKPENILLHDGRPMVADFGIALALSAAAGGRMTETGLSLGTPHYMSPEQATAEKEITGRSDTYSLASVMYEMLAGQPPHLGGSAQQIIMKIIAEPVAMVTTLRKSVPPNVAAALSKALEKLPADRFATAKEFADALVDPAYAGGGGRAAVRAASRGPRARFKDPVLLGAVVVAAGAAIMAGVQWRAAHRDSGETPVRFRLEMPPSVVLWTSTTQNTKIAISPDGKEIVFIGRPFGSTPHIYLRALNETRAHEVPGGENAQSIFLSPDGRWIGFLSNANLWKLPVEGGTPLPIGPAPGFFLGAAWTTSHQIVYSVNNRMYVVPDAGGTPRVITTLDSTHRDYSENQPRAHPDGKTVLYSFWANTGSASARVAALSLETGKHKVLDLAGVAPLGIVDDILVYATAAGALMAVPFDAKALRVTGTPVLVQTDVATNALSGAVQGALSSNGVFVYQAGSQLSQLMVSDARGAAHLLVPDVRSYAYPRYSPDGRKIAIGIVAGGRSDVWILDLASMTPTRLTTAGFLNERPEWSPDGKRVLYRSDEGGTSAIWWRPADLSGPSAPLLSIRGAAIFEAVLSPDGGKIVYQLDTAGADVYYRSLAGDTAPKPIAASPVFTEDMARLSPDGKWVAYMTDEPGVPQVVVQPFPGPGARIQVSTSGGVEPVWSRDGRRIFYRGNQQIIAASVRTQPEFAVTGRQVMFEDVFLGSTLPHANYDVAPDGAHFLFLRAATEPDLEVVYGWGAELKARVRGGVAP